MLKYIGVDLLNAKKLFSLKRKLHITRDFSPELIEWGEALVAFIVQSCAGKNAVYLFLSLHMIGYSFPHSLISRENSNAKCNFPCKEKSLVAFCDRSKWDRGFWKELQARFLPTDYRPWRLRGLYFLGGVPGGPLEWFYFGFKSMFLWNTQTLGTGGSGYRFGAYWPNQYWLLQLLLDSEQMLI